MPGPVATVGSMHVCPMLNPGVPPPPHVGGPVVGPGAPNVLFNNKPATLMGDMCTCAGPPDTIVQGEANVLINGLPVATLGCMTAHGGVITVGEPTIIISASTPSPIVTMPKHKIPFPEISLTLKAIAVFTGNGATLRDAEANREAIKKETIKNGFLNDFGFSI